MIGSQQRRPGSQHACTSTRLRNGAGCASILFFYLMLNARHGFHLHRSLHMLKRIYSPVDISVKAYIMGSWIVLRRHFDLALLFAALSDRTRLRLLNLMDGREVCVCYFVEILGQSQPKISRHLAYLRRAGVVAARREGKWMHYRIVVPSHGGAAKILRETLAVIREEKAMQADLGRLDKACCVPRKVSTLEGAPRPVIAPAIA